MRLNSDLVPHAHPEAQIVFALDQGIEDVIFVNNEPINLTYRTAVFANPMEKHAHRVCSQNCEYLALYFQKSWLIDMFGNPEHGRSFLKNSISVSDTIAELIDCLVSSAKGNASEDEISLWVEKIANQLQDHVVIAEAPDTERDVNHAVRKVEDAVSYMADSLLVHRDINLVAREIGVSRPQMFKLFRYHMKTTPNISWNALRMDYAKQQLEEVDISIEELSAELGFSEAANFSRFFKDHSGFNPSQFRLVAKTESFV
ncbi:AraC family transcriptional regulator [Parasphingorhabdus sp.]|uniref:AraC family transcriptional regulator n=1 Tax=Parasphingorhabdus sp. TaxID=2709688 RepID=UPI0032658886